MLANFKRFKKNSVLPYEPSQTKETKDYPLFESDELFKPTQAPLLTRWHQWIGKSIQQFLRPDHRIEMHTPEPVRDSQPILSDKKMTLHCKILQITNLSSSKAYPYTLRLQVAEGESQTYSGVMKRVARGVSTSKPQSTLSFPVEGRFSLSCDLGIQLQSGLVPRLKPKAENKVHAHLCLDSGSDWKAGFANKGMSRYAIQTTHECHPPLAMEMTLACWLEESDAPDTGVERDVLVFCQGGGYLTFYIQAESYPTWIRYWVTFENNELVLRLNERRGDPVEKIPLDPLTAVDVSPSEDLREEIYLGKKHGMILVFGSQVMYLFADNSKNLRYWQTLLQSFTLESSFTKHTIKQRYLWTQSSF